MISDTIYVVNDREGDDEANQLRDADLVRFRRCSAIEDTSVALIAASANIAIAAEPTKDEATPTARATEATNKNALSIGFLFGHGQKEAFKSGVGGRIGYTLPSRLYLGGTFVSHFGTQDGPVQANVWYGGGEVGYQFEAGPLVVRPYAGAGVASVHASIYIPQVGAYEGGRIQATESRVVFWPGASVLVPFDGGRAFLGVDAKYLVVESSSAFNAYATLGVAF